MKKRAALSLRIATLACFAGGAGWWIAFRVITGHTLEDALITFRYAENLAAGRGFVFNVGERVLGTTTPLLTLFLGLVGRILGPGAIPGAAALTMTGFGIATAVVIYYILKDLGFSAFTRILATLLFFGHELILVTSVGGMETPLVLFLMAASALALLKGREVLCLAVCAALILTRPDGLLWAGIMTLGVTLRTRRLPWKGILTASILVAPWLIFAFSYFGSPVPHSIPAKLAIASGPASSSHLSLAGVRHFAGWMIRATGSGWRSPLIALWALALILGTVSYLRARDRRGVGAMLIGYVALYGVFLFAGGAPHFEWYLAPVSLCLVLILAPGFQMLSRKVSEWLRLRPGSALGPAAVIAVVAFALFSQNRGTVEYYTFYQENETQTRRAIGLWLREHTPPGSVVAMEAIGYQAFYSGRPIVDLACLVSPRVVEIRKCTSSSAEFFSQAMQELRPDFLVLRSFEVDENRYYHGGLLFEGEEQRTYFFSHYSERARFAAPHPEIWGERAFLTVYGRSPDDLGGERLSSRQAATSP